jgi:hypothetical protein
VAAGGTGFTANARCRRGPAGFTLVQTLTAAYALHLDHERYGPLWSLPLQQVVYRQLMYLVVIQSTVMALVGDRLRWHRMTRTSRRSAAA